MSDAIEELFQPVFTAKPTVEGTGLGLSISYDITQPHAGTIEVGSAVDEFTEFIVQPAVQARLGTRERGVSSLEWLLLRRADRGSGRSKVPKRGNTRRFAPPQAPAARRRFRPFAEA